MRDADPSEPPFTSPTALGLDARLGAFALALLDPDKPAPPGLVGPDGLPSAKRFAVYRNNVVAGLIDVLRAAFPATCRIVGDDFFNAMARIHVSRTPPASPIMLDYGAGFPDFVGVFEPAATLPYLSDVARLERAWVEAYHAAEAIPLAPAAFAGIDPASLSSIRLHLHSALRIVRSRFPAVRIWQMNIGDGVPVAIDLGAGEDALVVRSQAEVAVHVLPQGAASFITALAARAPVAVAFASALSEAPCFDLGGALRGLLEAQAIIGWDADQDRRTA